MIGLSKTTADTTGDIVIYESKDSQIKELSARISRTATLDGGCVITHYGAQDSDRTFRVRVNLNETDSETLKNIFEGSTIIYCSTEIGFFSGAISKFKDNNGEIDLTFLVKEKLST
ncbi:MAG: hypothetical protein DRH26_06800 [Deltaproteobacteria bacterium]|nr:MAG: hypothetical protein DRH26_06800 [Deltaproteobacteria bacterium]